MQGQFDRHLKRYRTKKYPYDGGYKGISKKQYASLLKSSKENTSRYRVMVGKECFNCGRRGSRNVKKESNYYVCQAEDCGEKTRVMDKDFIDIISPCVTFNNHAGSTRSYDYVHDHVATGAVADFVPVKTEITSSAHNGECEDICLHDGSIMRIQKLTQEYDSTNASQAIVDIEKNKQEGKILTGLFYLEPTASDFHEINNTNDTPLNKLNQDALCPGKRALTGINDSFR